MWERGSSKETAVWMQAKDFAYWTRVATSSYEGPAFKNISQFCIYSKEYRKKGERIRK